jgi:predicted TIM-barrel fold metal-dependent hydrolase
MPVRIDAHVHVYNKGYWPGRWFNYVAEQWAAKHPGRSPSDIRDRIEPGLVDPGAVNLVRQMDQVGIDRAVILTVDWELGMGEPADVPIEKIRRQAVCGLKLYPPAGFYPYEHAADPLYDLCRSAGIPVAVHTGGTIGVLRPRFANPLYLQDVQRNFPGLALWIVHSGLSWWWEEALAVARGGIRTYLELSGWQEIAKHEEERFVRMLDTARRQVGAESLLFGSDHFSGARVRGTDSLREWVEWWADLPARAKRYGVVFTEKELDLILGENARQCLGL